MIKNFDEWILESDKYKAIIELEVNWSKNNPGGDKIEYDIIFQSAYNFMQHSSISKSILEKYGIITIGMSLKGSQPLQPYILTVNTNKDPKEIDFKGFIKEYIEEETDIKSWKLI